MIIETIKDLGLTEVETLTYLSLLENAPCTAGIIIKKTGFHKATIYQTLERLAEKGLVSSIKEGKHHLFQARSPEILLKKLKEKQDNLNKILPELLSKCRNKGKINAEIFKGKEGIKTVYREILEFKEYLMIGAGIPIKEVLGDYFEQIQLKKKQMKIKAKLLISESRRNTELERSLVGKYKYLPKEFEGPINTLIYDKKIAIILWTDLIAFVLEGEEVSKAYKKYFKVLWDFAKN